MQTTTRDGASEPATVTATTSNGFKVHAVHPMASSGYKYRRTTISGHVHIDEYVAPVGAWVYLGTLREMMTVGEFRAVQVAIYNAIDAQRDARSAADRDAAHARLTSLFEREHILIWGPRDP